MCCHPVQGLSLTLQSTALTWWLDWCLPGGEGAQHWLGACPSVTCSRAPWSRLGHVALGDSVQSLPVCSLWLGLRGACKRPGVMSAEGDVSSPLEGSFLLHPPHQRAPCLAAAGLCPAPSPAAAVPTCPPSSVCPGWGLFAVLMPAGWRTNQPGPCSCPRPWAPFRGLWCFPSSCTGHLGSARGVGSSGSWVGGR